MGFKSPVTAKRVAAYVLEDQARVAVEYLAEHVFISDWFDTLSERDQGAVYEAAETLARPFIERMEKIAAPIAAEETTDVASLPPARASGASVTRTPTNIDGIAALP